MYFMFDHWITSSGRPPSTINSIDIVSGTVDVETSTILLNITWEPPHPYGELQYYEIQLIGRVSGITNYTFGGQRIPVRLLTKSKSKRSDLAYSNFIRT